MTPDKAEYDNNEYIADTDLIGMMSKGKKQKMTIKSYFGSKRCCDCGQTGNYIINKNGYQFTVCADCVQNYSEEEEQEEEND